ncbi:hypothetical protein BT67DRAFT_424242 [Trichocladium antarcticum]|uniref:Nicotinamide riboside kinase 1 n=1 Tax=Trichocladium antarcticum TaxID=1450529 RepID=A0AAN6UIE6_9PEZI|nr:hypothetical protein BT67DRAFT_424242 [Trichocladium antarcticum]
MDHQRAVIVGISGCSSSGKTTLARLLRDMFPETFILHEDDFYKPESELPIKDGLVDWDCADAISFPDLERALCHIRATGTYPVSTAATTPGLTHRTDHGCRCPGPPSPSPSAGSSHHPATNHQPTVLSKEDLNSVGPSPAPPAQLAACTALVQHWLSPGQPGALIFPPPNQNPDPPRPKTRLCLLDGFLLYAPPTKTTKTTKTNPPPALSRVAALIDIKLLLRASRAAALRRRAARAGYVTLEGFWTDPPGYVETVVWPNYAASHGWLFEDGVVERGRLDGGVLGREGIHAFGCGDECDECDGDGEAGEDVEFGRVVRWAARVVMRELERVVLGRG